MLTAALRSADATTPHDLQMNVAWSTRFFLSTCPHLEQVWDVYAETRKDHLRTDVTVVEPRGSPTKIISGCGFCLDCYAAGQYTLAADEQGSACSTHLRAKVAASTPGLG
jgi:hypothetical protein